MMTKEEKVVYWLDIADYDIETAEAMYNSGRWLYVGFMCHQVIEKTLKAYWCGTQPEDPPYTHNLVLLSDKTGLGFAERRTEFIYFTNDATQYTSTLPVI